MSRRRHSQAVIVELFVQIFLCLHRRTLLAWCRLTPHIDNLSDANHAKNARYNTTIFTMCDRSIFTRLATRTRLFNCRCTLVRYRSLSLGSTFTPFHPLGTASVGNIRSLLLANSRGARNSEGRGYSTPQICQIRAFHAYVNFRSKTADYSA